VAVVEDVCVGFAMMGPPHHEPAQVAIGSEGRSSAAELLAVAVEPGFQNQGIGTLLMQSVEDAALKKGIKRIILHTSTDNAPAKKLFGSRGFLPFMVRKQFYPEGQDALLMIWDADQNDT
jgi:ribosomal-protein-alanine N-acetyltransferase